MPPAASLSRQMRLAGCCYLFVIVSGAFAEVVVRQAVIVAGDAASTAQALVASETLWRWGLVVHLLYLVPAALTNLLLFVIFRTDGPIVATFMLILGMLAVAVEASALAFIAVPLVLLDEEQALQALAGEQGEALSYLAMHLFSAGWGFALTFFAGFCVLLGVLIVRSSLVPRLLGMLMIVAGACYLTSTLVSLLDPAMSSRMVPWILLPCLLGELTLALWLAAGQARSGPERPTQAPS